MKIEDVFWPQHILSMYYKPSKFIYIYLMLLTGPTVDHYAINRVPVNLKTETLNSFLKP
jgi:hypothetical protein